MPRLAAVLCLLAGLCSGAIGLYLLIVRPEMSEQWMGVWVSEMGTGRTFHINNAATLFGALALGYAVLLAAAAVMMSRHLVAAGVVAIGLNMVACGVIAICPDPKAAVYAWAVPGLLLAGVGFLLGPALQREHAPRDTAGS